MCACCASTPMPAYIAACNRPSHATRSVVHATPHNANADTTQNRQGYKTLTPGGTQLMRRLQRPTQHKGPAHSISCHIPTVARSPGQVMCCCKEPRPVQSTSQSWPAAHAAGYTTSAPRLGMHACSSQDSSTPTHAQEVQESCHVCALKQQRHAS